MQIINVFVPSNTRSFMSPEPLFMMDTVSGDMNNDHLVLDDTTNKQTNPQDLTLYELIELI
jgi:hypothetical protein